MARAPMVVHLGMFVCLSEHVTQTNSIASIDLVFVYATTSKHVARSSFILLQFQMFLFVFTYTRKLKFALERKGSMTTVETQCCGDSFYVIVPVNFDSGQYVHWWRDRESHNKANS